MTSIHEGVNGMSASITCKFNESLKEEYYLIRSTMTKIKLTPTVTIKLAMDICTKIYRYIDIPTCVI